MGSVPVAIPITVLTVILVLSLLGMWRGWNSKTKRSAAILPELPAIPPELGGSPSGSFQVTYVSSTTAGDWLDRVATHDLGFKSAAFVEVFDSGVLIERVGAESVFIPAENLVGVSFTKGMAGKFMGREAIVVLTWLPSLLEPEFALDTGILPAHSAERDPLAESVRALIPSADNEEATTSPTVSVPHPDSDTDSTQPGSSEPKEHK